MAQNGILVRSRIKKGRQLLNENRLEEACTIYEQICKSARNDIDAWLTLAVIHRRLGQFGEAEAACSHVLFMLPDHAWANHIRGSIQQCQGDLAAAAAGYRTAIALDPSLAEAYYFLGNVYQELGQFREAAESYRSAISGAPDYLEALSNLGAVLVVLHQLDEARAVLERANMVRPNCEQVLCNLGDLSLEEDDLEKASYYARAALKANPQFFDAYYLLGKMYRQRGDYDKALDNYNKALKIKHDDETVIGSIAEILEIRGEFDRAWALLKPLVEKNTSNPLALLAYSALARNYEQEKTAIHLLESSVLEGSLVTAHQIGLHSELGKQYNHLGDYPQAFRHYEQANQLERELNEQLQTGPGHPSVDDIEGWFNQYGADYWKGLSRSDSASSLPIFVVGMPRSGTTLAEQILASHPYGYGAGELPDIGRLAHSLGTIGEKSAQVGYLAGLDRKRLHVAAERYIQVLKRQSPTSLRVVDKMPTNFWHLGLISLLFPGARVIHMMRDPRDTCLSMYFQRFGSSMTFTTDLRNLAAYYTAYSRVMAYWKTVLDIEILEVRYEELVVDQERVIRNMIAYCGLEWDESCLYFHATDRDVNTPSYDQVRQPMYSKSVGRWKHYEKQLAPLTAGLAPILDKGGWGRL